MDAGSLVHGLRTSNPARFEQACGPLNGDPARSEGNKTGEGAAIGLRPLPCLDGSMEGDYSLHDCAVSPAQQHLFPAPVRRGGILRFIAIWILCFIVIYVAAVVIGEVSGCTAAQTEGVISGAKSAQTQLVGSPTTAPSPYVRSAEAIYPPLTPWVNVVGGVLGVFVIAASTLYGWQKSAAAAAATNAVAEVVNDVKSWNQPGTPFTAKTEKIVTDAAGIVAAAPLPAPAASITVEGIGGKT